MAEHDDGGELPSVDHGPLNEEPWEKDAMSDSFKEAENICSSKTCHKHLKKGVPKIKSIF